MNRHFLPITALLLLPVGPVMALDYREEVQALQAHGKDRERYVKELFDTIEEGRVDQLERLLTKRGSSRINAQLTNPADCYKSLLHTAAGCGELACMELLISMGADIEARDVLERTPLHLAKNVACTRLLLQVNAHVEAEDRDTTTPLEYAAQRGDLASVRELIRMGAEVNKLYGESALYGALEYNTIDYAIGLLQAGADIESELKKQIAAGDLEMADQLLSFSCAIALLQAGADVESDIRKCAEEGDLKMVDQLISLSWLRLPSQREVRACRARVAQSIIEFKALAKGNETLDGIQFPHKIKDILLSDKDLRNDIITIYLDELRIGKRDPFAKQDTLQEILFNNVQPYIVPTFLEFLKNVFTYLQSNEDVADETKRRYHPDLLDAKYEKLLSQAVDQRITQRLREIRRSVRNGTSSTSSTGIQG